MARVQQAQTRKLEMDESDSSLDHCLRHTHTDNTDADADTDLDTFLYALKQVDEEEKRDEKRQLLLDSERSVCALLCFEQAASCISCVALERRTHTERVLPAN